MELQQQKTKQAGVSRCANPYPLFTNSCLDRGLRYRVRMGREFYKYSTGYL
jgi:hypothetical protein